MELQEAKERMRPTYRALVDMRQVLSEAQREVTRLEEKLNADMRVFRECKRRLSELAPTHCSST